MCHVPFHPDPDLPMLLQEPKHHYYSFYTCSCFDTPHFRFHSCVVLVEIWKNTYRTKEPL